MKLSITGKACFNPKPRSEKIQKEQQEVDEEILTFDRIVILCMSKLKIYDLDVIERMTLREFNYRMYALEYEQLDRDMDMYKLAFAIRDAAAEKRNVVVKRRNRISFQKCR